MKQILKKVQFWLKVTVHKGWKEDRIWLLFLQGLNSYSGQESLQEDVGSVKLILKKAISMDEGLKRSNLVKDRTSWFGSLWNINSHFRRDITHLRGTKGIETTLNFNSKVWVSLTMPFLNQRHLLRFGKNGSSIPQISADQGFFFY